jgi:hypothetical protein
VVEATGSEADGEQLWGVVSQEL